MNVIQSTSQLTQLSAEAGNSLIAMLSANDCFIEVSYVSNDKYNSYKASLTDILSSLISKINICEAKINDYQTSVDNFVTINGPDQMIYSHKIFSNGIAINGGLSTDTLSARTINTTELSSSKITTTELTCNGKIADLSAKHAFWS